MRGTHHALIDNIGMVHTTGPGAERIRRNLGLADEDPAEWCRSRILDKDAAIHRRGKNWYVHVRGCVITINANSGTIITAHKEE